MANNSGSKVSDSMSDRGCPDPQRKRGGRFTADESDRFVRLVGLYGMAEDVLGSKRDASEWMSTPNRSLGGVSPAKFALTETGAREVEDLLGRIAQGVAT